MTNEKPEERTTIKPGQILKSQKGIDYLVEICLGSGGFGEVWKVALLNEKEKKFAMKTEQNVAHKKDLLRLKCEVNLFEEIERASNRIDKSHFVKMHDKGKTAQFKYLVMDLIWLSLKDVKDTVCDGVFSPHTKIKIARQTLKGIESLHEIGFLHRDIKPHNFAVGLPPKESIVYLLDFGIARPFRNKDGGVRKPRRTVKFMGTLMYASMECLCRNEQSRRDDLEVWMYMMIELYDRMNLSWCNLEPDEAQLHVEYRTELMQKSRELHAEGKLKVPEKWCDIIELLNGMSYEDPGDFTQINLFLSQMCVDENIDENLPLDWVGKKPKSPDKAKVAEKKKEKKKEDAVRKKKTDGQKEGEQKERKFRRNRKSDDDSEGSLKKSDEGSDEENLAAEFEAFMKWRRKKLRRSGKRRTRDRGSNDNSDQRQLRRKEPVKKSDEKKKENDVDGNEEGPKEVDGKEGTDKNAANPTPEKKDSGEGKKKRDSGERKSGPKKMSKSTENNDKENLRKISGGIPESNESNNDREDKKKKAKKTSGSREEKDGEDKKIGVRRRGSTGNGREEGGKKKKSTNGKTLEKDEKKAEKPSSSKPPTPEPKKANEVVGAVKKK